MKTPQAAASKGSAGKGSVGKKSAARVSEAKRPVSKVAASPKKVSKRAKPKAVPCTADSGAAVAREVLPAVTDAPRVAKPAVRLASTRGADPRLPPGLIFVTVLVVVLIVIALNGLNDAQMGRGGNLVERAEEAIAQKDWPAALGAIQKVNESHRQQPAFQRVLADYLEETHSSPHTLVEVLERLKKSGEFRPMDQVWLCRAWLATNHLDKARAAWDAIPAPLCEGLEATRLKVELLRQEGQLREAAQLQADLNAEFADVPLVAVRLAVTELNGSFPEVRQKAQARLGELARRRDQAGLEALRVLSRYDGHTEKQAADLVGLASKHPLATPADRQGLVSLLMRLSPARRAELLQAEIDRCEDQDPAALALWLAREGETKRLQGLSAELRRVQPVAWFQTVARALAEAKQWQELMKLVEEQQAERSPVSAAELLRWHAVALMQLHPEDVAAPHAELQHSIRKGAVEKNFACVALAAQIAEDWHMLDLALEAGLVLSHPGAPHEARMLENTRRIATQLKDTKVLAEIAARLTALEPENVLYARQAAYLRLLRGEKIEATLMAEDTTTEKSAATLLALALKAWRLNDRPQAAAMLNRVRDTSDLTTGERAVYAGLLASACGKVAQAYQIAEKIRVELLLEEEVGFLKRAL